MRSEALRNIGTMRQITTTLDIARNRKLKTTNSLSRTKEETERLESLTDRRLEQVLEKEKRRFAAQETSVNKSRQRVLRSRNKLAATINRNRALTELRYQMQYARWQGKTSSVPLKSHTPDGEPALRQIEVTY